MEVETLLHRQGGLCFYCRKPLAVQNASIEHVIPVSKNGANGYNNLAACCKLMNSHLNAIAPKHKIEILLNWWGKSPCPHDIMNHQNKEAYVMPILPTDFGDPGHYINTSEFNDDTPWTEEHLRLSRLFIEDSGEQNTEDKKK